MTRNRKNKGSGKKTALEVLKIIFIRRKDALHFECLERFVAGRKPEFEVHCTVDGYLATGIGFSKKVARQDAAANMLVVLAEHGYPVPEQWHVRPEEEEEEDYDDDEPEAGPAGAAVAGAAAAGAAAAGAAAAGAAGGSGEHA